MPLSSTPLITAIAKAVEAIINAGQTANQFAPEAFTAAMVYDPTLDSKQLKELHVQVVPLTREMERASRTSMQRDVQVQIVVRQHVQPDNNDRIEQLLALAEAIDGYLCELQTVSITLPGIGPVQARWVASEHNPIYDGPSLMVKHEFLSVITAMYRVVEP